MVADRVEVATKKAGNKESWKWVSDGESGFEIKKDVKKITEHQSPSILMRRERVCQQVEN